MTIDVRRLARITLFQALVLALVLALATPLLANGASGVNDRSNWQYVGAENPSKSITVTVWLKQRNKAELNEMVQRMYEKGSSTFHHWLTRDEYRQRFAPTAAAAAQVQSYLTARGFTVTSVDKFNHYVSVQGSVGNVEKTFSVELQRVNVDGEIHRVSNTEASISGPVGELVRGVTGLDDFRVKNALARPFNPATGKPLDGRPLTMADIGGAAQPCLIGAPIEKTYSYRGVSATYSGNSYSGFAPTVGGWCAYIPSQIQAGYGLNALYNNGWDGTGQTIIIVGAWGSNTIEADANTFSAAYGLPPLSSSNFHIYYPGGKVRCGKGCDGWNVETTLDVEWAHTVAPGANIVLVLAPDNTNTTDIAELWAIENAEEISTPYANGDFGYVISNSWLSYIENLAPKSVLDTEYDYTQLAAALGISVNFSSGDGGDAYYQGHPNVAMPASSPYATAVGGTSVFMDSNGVVQNQVGWGNNFAELADIHGHPYDPPNGFFDGGSGGGTSAIWPAPSFQSSLGNSYRELPDISYLADAFTGVSIIITYGGKLQVFEAGGTSLSCPMFSALWAIANQAAGSAAPLGQAAAMLYSLPADAITDIVPVGSDTNVSGTVTDSSGTTTYTADDLVHPETSAPYISVLDVEQCAGNQINCNKTNLFWGELVGFGTDSSLFTAPGWDNVTGMGVPNGLPFVQDVVAALP